MPSISTITFKDLTEKEQKFYKEFIHDLQPDELDDKGFTEIYYKDGIDGFTKFQIGAILSTLKEKGVITSIDKKDKTAVINGLIEYPAMIDAVATFKNISDMEFADNREFAKFILKLLKRFDCCDQGTIDNPSDLASSVMTDGRTLIQAILEDGEVRYNDGWNIVEVDSDVVYIDYTGYALEQMDDPYYRIDTNIESEDED